jgi:hypothetical protein
MANKHKDMTPQERQDARDNAIRFQVLYEGKDKGHPIVNFKAKERVKARAFYLAQKRAGFDVHWWDTLDNTLSSMFSFGAGR